LFAGMLKVNRYVHPNDRLDLTNSPIGLIWMDHKFTETEIEQRLKSMVLGIAKGTKKAKLCPDMNGWLLASLFRAKSKVGRCLIR